MSDSKPPDTVREPHADESKLSSEHQIFSKIVRDEIYNALRQTRDTNVELVRTEVRALQSRFDHVDGRLEEGNSEFAALKSQIASQNETIRILRETLTAIMADANALRPSGNPPPPSVLVLVVEDETLVRQALCRALVVRGLRVLEAHDLEDAEANLQCNPDVALVDLRLRQQDGMDLIRTIRAKHVGIGCVVYSAYCDNRQRAELSELNVEVIDKPADLEVILAAVVRARGAQIVGGS